MEDDAFRKYMAEFVTATQTDECHHSNTIATYFTYGYTTTMLPNGLIVKTHLRDYVISSLN